MEVVKLDNIVVRRSRAISPRPANGNPCIKSVVNFIVGNCVATALPNPDAYRGWVDFTQVPNMIVGDDISSGGLIVVIRVFRVTDFYSPCAEVGHAVRHDAVTF